MIVNFNVLYQHVTQSDTVAIAGIFRGLKFSRLNKIFDDLI